LPVTGSATRRRPLFQSAGGKIILGGLVIFMTNRVNIFVAEGIPAF